MRKFEANVWRRSWKRICGRPESLAIFLNSLWKQSGCMLGTTLSEGRSNFLILSKNAKSVWQIGIWRIFFDLVWEGTEYKAFLWALGKAITHIRRDSCLTQSQLAARAKRKQPAIAKLENGPTALTNLHKPDQIYSKT